MGIKDHGTRWKERIERSSHGFWLIGLASYLESIIVPIPLEVVLVPYLIARRDRLWTIATVVTAGCLLGALTGYGVGYFLIETVGRTLVDTLGWSAGMERFRGLFEQHGFWAIVGLGVIPIPFQIAMLVAGASAYPLLLFVLASGLARGVRYYGLAGLVRAFGEHAQPIWDRHATGIGLGTCAVCVVFLALSFWGR
jgi:membrane protein YqaA with SNARE-associated domain